jgi:hypothetical protein
MRKLFASLFMSLDGVVENPAWTMSYFDDTGMEILKAAIGEQDTVLLGRVSYEEWAGFRHVHQ